MNNEKGFLLFELVIFILVMGIIAGAIAPSYVRTIGAGRENATEVEMVKIKKGLMAYYEDNHEMPPEYIHIENPTTSLCADPGSGLSLESDYIFQIGITELLMARCNSPNDGASPSTWVGPYVDAYIPFRDVQSDSWGELKEYPWDWAIYYEALDPKPNVLPASYLYDKDPIIYGKAGGINGSIKAVLLSRGINRIIDCEDDDQVGNDINLTGRTPNMVNSVNINWRLNPDSGCNDDLLVQVSTMEVDKVREEATKKEMLAIKKAILGNSDLVQNGLRTDFGFVGDIGQLPIKLEDLVIQPTLCDADYLSCTCNATELCNWNGPYLVTNSFSDPIVDEWGEDYLYAPLLSGALRNRVGNVAIDGDGADAPFRSKGKDKMDDSGEYDKSKIAHCSVVLPDLDINRFCDDITLRDGVGVDTIREPFLTSDQVIPAEFFDVDIQFSLKNGGGGDWPPSDRKLRLVVDFEYKKGDGIVGQTDTLTIVLNSNAAIFTTSAPDVITVGSSLPYSEIIFPIPSLVNKLPIGFCKVTATLEIDDDPVFGSPVTIGQIENRIQILPKMTSISMNFDFGDMKIDNATW